MPADSIQELEVRLEKVLEDMRDIDVEITRHESDNREADLLRKLRDAYFAYADAVRRRIASKLECIAHRESMLLRDKLRAAEIELVEAEAGLRDFDNGMFTQRVNRLRSAENDWWNALGALWKHRSARPCFNF